eukprot:2656048-Prymnesium_polylepis.1
MVGEGERQEGGGRRGDSHTDSREVVELSASCIHARIGARLAHTMAEGAPTYGTHSTQGGAAPQESE